MSVPPASDLQGDPEPGVAGLLDEPGPGNVLRGDPGGRLGQQRVSPAINDGERTGSVEVAAKARPHSGQDADCLAGRTRAGRAELRLATVELALETLRGWCGVRVRVGNGGLGAGQRGAPAG